MGAEPWDYFVPFQDDIQAALEDLRHREFRAGRFRGSELDPDSIDEAIENMDADGTASILDIDHVADQPEFCAVAPMPRDSLVSLFGTDRPSRRMIESNLDFYEDIDRGQGVYIVAYENDQPAEIFFGGYSFD
jgi:hypothetical protein